MLEKRPEAPQPSKPAPPAKPSPKRRDMAREDADSPYAIPLFPPQGDGS